MGIRFHQEIKNTTTELNMKVSFCLLIALAVLLSVLLPEVDAKPRQRSRGRGRGKFRGARRMQPRRGRQDADVPADDMNAVDYDEAADDAEGSGGEELYNGCDWKTNIGGFLNFCKWRKWCADNQGITDFGPYGGVPTACPPEEEGADEAMEVEEATPEARRRARARRSRARKGRKSGAAKRRKQEKRRPSQKRFRAARRG